MFNSVVPFIPHTIYFLVGLCLFLICPCIVTDKFKLKNATYLVFALCSLLCIEFTHFSLLVTQSQTTISPFDIMQLHNCLIFTHTVVRKMLIKCQQSRWLLFALPFSVNYTVAKNIHLIHHLNFGFQFDCFIFKKFNFGMLKYFYWIKLILRQFFVLVLLILSNIRNVIVASYILSTVKHQKD